MSEYDKYTIQDLINYTADQKPIEFQTAFNSLLLDRIDANIQDAKASIAQSMFNGADHEELETADQ